MPLLARKKNARAECDRRRLRARPHHTRPFENADHFFVKMKVVGRAAGRDRSDELCRLALNQFAIPAVAGFLDRLIVEADRLDVAVGIRRCSDTDEYQLAMARPFFA